MAKEVNWIEINNRNYLKDVLPLDTPYSIQVEAIKACNFKCNYCVYSTDKNIKYSCMDLDTYNKLLYGISLFSKKLKNIIFTGLGEPLLNNNIYKMIEMSLNYSDNVTLITNGSLLNKSNIDKLLKTGINEIRISMQGLTEEDYYKICGYRINFQEFIDNVSYLYKNRGETKIALKIADIALNTEEKQKKFFELFENISDYLIIQKISPLQNDVNYDGIIKDYSKNLYFNDIDCINDINVCPMPFFTFLIFSNGNVIPCCSVNDNVPIVGNILENNLYDIWNSDSLKNIRIQMLRNSKKSIDGCKDCIYPIMTNNKYDNIDDYAEELLKKYE